MSGLGFQLISITDGIRSKWLKRRYCSSVWLFTISMTDFISVKHTHLPQILQKKTLELLNYILFKMWEDTMDKNYKQQAMLAPSE